MLSHLSGKWTRPRDHVFLGIGIAVAGMCPVLRQYHPSGDQTGGLTGKVDISLEMRPTGDLVAIRCPYRNPYQPVSACRAFPSLGVPGRNRTCDLLLKKTGLGYACWSIARTSLS